MLCKIVFYVHSTRWAKDIKKEYRARKAAELAETELDLGAEEESIFSRIVRRVGSASVSEVESSEIGSRS